METTRFRRTSRALVAALLVLGAAVGATACGSDGAPGPSSAGSSTRAPAPLGVEAFAAVAARPGTTILDVRTPPEYAAGHLAGAVNLDVQGSAFAEAVGRLDPSASYAVYCHSGNRSAVAVAYLADHGFRHVVELQGGIVAWQAAGRPVTTS